MHLDASCASWASPRRLPCQLYRNESFAKICMHAMCVVVLLCGEGHQRRAAGRVAFAMASTELEVLTQFLRTAHPRDVLIPCAVGDKRPYYPYKLGWTWEDYEAVIASEAFCSRAQTFDWAIILQDLCVVDCDSPEAAEDLEGRFPLLREAPCAKTRKGLHYYFKRSPLADAGSYYDCSGYAQIVTNVDFKSVTKTGTGGISTQRRL